MTNRAKTKRATTVKIKALDIIIIGLVLAAAVVSGLAIYGNRSDQVRLVIESTEGKWLYGLDTDRTVDIPGQIGITVVEIHDGKAHVVDSPCANKTCVAAPSISRVGEWTACLPNQVMLRVEAVSGSGEENEGIDAVVR